MQQLAIVMHANCQWTHLGTFQDLVDLFMRQFEILTGGHLKLNQTDIIVAGDNTRTSTGGQHAFNARGALIRRVATAQLQVDFATGYWL